MIRTRFTVILLLAISYSLFRAAGDAEAHGLRHSVSEGEALVISVFYDEETEFSNQSYEIYRPGEETPFKVGRTDALGRIVFIPDCDGEWRVRAFSKGGHGLDIKVEASGHGGSTDAGGVRSERNARVILGASIIIAVFGIISLLYGRRRRQ